MVWRAVSLPSGSGEAGGCQTSPFPAPALGAGGLWELEGCLRPLSLWECSSGLHALPAGASLPGALLVTLRTHFGRV